MTAMLTPPATFGRLRHTSRATVASWVVFLVCALWVLGHTITYDFRTQPLAGDTASHLMQALSLAYDSHSLNYDARDLQHWQQMGWAAQPVGMFFQSYDHGRYGFAKPYGYSLFVAPFIAAFGPVSGVAVANTTLLALLMGVSVALLLTRFRGPAVPLTVGAFFLASYPYMYAYWMHTELFLALLVLLAFTFAVRFAQTQRPVWALPAMAVMGYGMSEKAAYIALFGPLGLVMLWKAKRTWLRIAMPLTAILVFAIAVIPYLRYSDWASFTPYGGNHRLYVSSVAPFAGSPTGWASTTFTEGSLVDGVRTSVVDKLEALAYTVVGEHTGMLVFLPIGLALIGAGLARWRKTDAWGRVAVGAVLLYILFYALIFPKNYYGGGQTLGNRYLLQMAPAMLAIPVLAGIRARTLVVSSLVGIVLGLVMLWPQHMHPSSAHVNIERTSALQRLLPEESNQTYLVYFQCRKQDVTHITVCPAPAGP